MPAWQPVEGEGLLDRLLGPVGEPGIFGAPSGEPLGEIGAGLGEVAPVVEPAQFLQAVVVGLPWQVIERVPPEVHVAALRSEEHTTELQSLMCISYAVFCLKKKNNNNNNTN